MRSRRGCGLFTGQMVDCAYAPSHTRLASQNTQRVADLKHPKQLDFQQIDFQAWPHAHTRDTAAGPFNRCAHAHPAQLH